MQASDDDQASARYTTPRNDIDDELNDGYGEGQSARRRSYSNYRTNSSLGRGEELDDAEFFGASPVTPLMIRMDREARSTPLSQHYQPQGLYLQNERGTYQNENDVAIAQGARRSGSLLYKQRTQQEDLSVNSVRGLCTTQKAKQSLQRQGLITTPVRRPHISSNASARNNGSPANYSGGQNQEMGTGQQRQQAGRRVGYNMQESSPLRTRAMPSLSPNQSTLQQLVHQQRILQQQILQLQQNDQQQHIGFTPNRFHSSPLQLQQRKRPYADDHSRLVIPNSLDYQNHFSIPPQSSYRVLSTASAQQQPTMSISHSHLSPTAHSTTQAMTSVQVQSQFQPTATFPPTTAMLQRDHSDSTLVSIEQPLDLLSSSPSSNHRLITTSVTLQEHTKEAAAKAIPTRKKKPAKEEIETRIANARLAYGGSVGWCQLYKDLKIGMLPTVEQLRAHNPPSAMKLLFDVPISKSRANSEVGHFFERQSMNNAHHYAYKYKYHQHGNDDSNSDYSDNDDNNNDDDNNNNNNNNDDDDDDEDDDDGNGGNIDNNNNNNKINNSKRNKHNRPNSKKGKGVSKDKAGKDTSQRFRCQMVITPATGTQPELRCGKPYATGQGTRSRRRHMDREHPGVRNAVLTFRQLQLRVQHPEKFISDDSDIPKCECGGAERNQLRFSEMLIDLISEASVPMSIIQHKAFKKIISYANPNLIVQDSDTLWQQLEDKMLYTKGKLVEELHRDCPNGSLTADSWTSDDGRKFQAVTYHYLSPEFEMGKVLVGMDEIKEPQQKAEVLLKSLDNSLSEWNLHDNVVATTTDQGSNVKKCMSLFRNISKATWFPCAAHKIQIAINNAWRDGGALPLLDKCRKISRIFKNKDALADYLAKSQKKSGIDNIKPITMNETRWNSRYEMAKRIIKLNPHIDNTITHFNAYPNLLPAHVRLDELNGCSLSNTELDALLDIELLLEKASKYGNNMGASTIPTISQMYLEASTLLPDFTEMKSDIGMSVYRELEAGIRLRWSFSAPAEPVAPASMDGRSISDRRRAEYNAEMEIFHTTIKQQDTLLAAMYLDPNLLDNEIWKGESGNALKGRAQTYLINEVVEDQRKKDHQNVLGKMDLAPTGLAKVIMYEQYVTKMRHMNEMGEFEGAPHLFWRKHRGIHSELAIVARRLLCIQSTSCEAERVFSKAGYLTSNRKSSLSTPHLRDILFSCSITKALTALQMEREKAKRASMAA